MNCWLVEMHLRGFYGFAWQITSWLVLLCLLLLIIFRLRLHVDFSPQPRWQPAVGSCMWHQVADYQRCIAALTHGRPLLAWCPPHSSPDCTHTPHILPQMQGCLRGQREIKSNYNQSVIRWHIIKSMWDGKTQLIWWCLSYKNFTILNIMFSFRCHQFTRHISQSLPRDSFFHQLLHFGCSMVKVINDGDSGENPPIHYVWPLTQASNCGSTAWMWAD